MTARRALEPDSCFWSDRCYWVRTADGDEVLIPMCIGSSHHPSGCTCGAPQSRIERAEERAEIARGEVARLRQKMAGARDWSNDLQAQINYLKTRLREAGK